MKIWRGWLPVLTAASVLVALVHADAADPKDSTRKHKIVYQLSDAGVDKAKFVLGNIRNHASGVGGWQNIEALQMQGMTFGACGNTMKNFSITADQLPPKSHILPQGGVVRIMELQEQGYIYLRP